MVRNYRRIGLLALIAIKLKLPKRIANMPSLPSLLILRTFRNVPAMPKPPSLSVLRRLRNLPALPKLPKLKKSLPDVILSEVGAHATTESKDPEDALCNHAAQGVSAKYQIAALHLPISAA
jgi:hypothetical protein